jgi:hypothetical protein
MIAIYAFYFQYLPYQDFPQWIYHGHVFNQIVFHHNDFGGYFWFHPYIPPNASATVLIGLFETFASPIIAGKIFLVLCCTLIYFGSFYLLTILTKSKHLMFAFISFSGTFSLYFYMGLMNFVFGLGIALLGTCYVFTRKEKANLWVIAELFLLCYCSHFASLLILLVPVLSVLIYTKDRIYFRRILIASLPTIALLVHYYFTKEILTFSSSGILGGGYFETMWGTIIHFPALMMPFHRVKHVYEPVLFANFVNYTFAILLHLAALIFVYCVFVRREKSLIAITGILTLILMVVSPQYLGGLFNLGERFVYLFWILLVAFSFILFSKPWMRKLLTGIAVSLAITSIASAWYSTQRFNEMDIAANSKQFSDYDPHGGSNPFFHHHFYDDMLQNRGVPIFHHALFDYPGAENSKPFDQ